MAHTDQIVFFDTTLRDGEQSPGCTMHPGEKLRFAHQLAALGVDIIEAGFPIASAGDFDSVRTIAKEVKGVRIAALARAKQAGMLRNVSVAMGNLGLEEFRGPLKEMAASDDAMVAEHAQWALEQLL